MTYAKYGSVTATDYNNRLVSVNNVWSIGSGSYGWGQPSIGAVTVGEVVTAAQSSFNWDTFISLYRGSYSAATYRAQAEEIYPYYHSNIEYTITSPTTESRWGLYKYPDQSGLAYWTNQLLAANNGVVTLPDQNFTNQFFAAVDAFPGYTRDKTPNKSFDYGEPIEWAKLIQTLNNISTHEVGGSAGLSVPVTGNLIEWLSQLDTKLNQLCDTGATNNRFGNYTQFDDQNPIRGTYSQPWNETLGTTATVTFASADAARYFFNAGGRINISISYSGGSGTPQDSNWATLCANAGTMWVQALSSGGTSTNTNCGYYGSAGRMYSANGSGAYASNTLTVDVAGQGTAQLSFAVNLADNHTNSWADNVTGTFTVTVLVRKPSMRGLLSVTWGTPVAVVPNFVASSVPAVPTPGGGGSPDAGGGLPSSAIFYGSQRYLNDPEIYNYWTVPNGVSSVCVILISGGGGGGAATLERNGQGGGGGGLLWINDIPVTPGDVWTIWKPYGGRPAKYGEDATGASGGPCQITINNAMKGIITVAGGVGGATGSVFIDPSNGQGSQFYNINLPSYGSFGFGRGGNGGLGSPFTNQRGGGGGGAGGYTGSGGNGASWTTTQLPSTAGAGGGGGGGAPTGTEGTIGYLPLGGSGGGVGYIGQGSGGMANGGGGSTNSGGSFGLYGGRPGNVAEYGRDPNVLDPRDNTQFYGGGVWGGGGGGGVILQPWDPAYNPGNGLWGAAGLIRIIWGDNRAYPNLNVGAP